MRVSTDVDEPVARLADRFIRLVVDGLGDGARGRNLHALRCLEVLAITFAMCLVATAGFGRDARAHTPDPVWELDTGDDVPVAVAVNGSGSIAIVGYTAVPDDPSDDAGVRPYATLLDATGRALWTRRDLAGAATAVTVDPSGAVTVVGPAHAPSDTTADVIVTQLDARGATVWERRFTPPTLPSDLDVEDRRSHIEAKAVIADGRGNVAVVGNTWIQDGGVALTFDTYVTLLSGAGSTLWTRTLEHGAPDSGWDVAFDHMGDVVVVGGAWGAIDGASGTGTGAYVWKLDRAGGTRWVTQFGASIDDDPTGIAITADGTIVVVGSGYQVHETPSDFGAFVRTFDADGEPMWTRPVGRPAEDDAQGVTVDAHANPLVLTNPVTPCSSGHGPTLWGFTIAGEAVGATPIRHLEHAVGHGLAHVASGNAIIAGNRRCSGNVQGFVVKVATDGARSK